MIDPKSVSKFVDSWKERGSEKSDTQMFWISLLRDVFGVEKPDQIIRFEQPIVVEGRMCFIDARIYSTKILIEQKSRGVDLDKPIRQSDGKMLTPFRQALRYAAELSALECPRWIVTCNFDEFRIYDLKSPHNLFKLNYFDEPIPLEPQIIPIEMLPREYGRLNFFVDPNDENVYPEIRITKRAVKIIGKLRSEIKRSWTPQQIEQRRDALNRFCVRLVFCLYAEDDLRFPKKAFTDYVRNAEDRRAALIDLFRAFNIPEDDPKRDPALKQFPYVDGDLFTDADDIPPFPREVAHHILVKLDDEGKGTWADIDTTIFGSLFESDLQRDIQHEGGMYYTSAANIHKLIYPLFLDELNAEFKLICRKRKTKRQELENFQLKLASLTFFDPACGSGNFLTETYIRLRELENEVLRELRSLGAICTVKVTINQFYGIEKNDFACAIARTAMWIAESQMLHRSEMFLTEEDELLPLKHSARIVCGNALRLDWKGIVPDGVDYIIGNPPFIGHQWRSKEQVADMSIAFHDLAKHGKLDYVCAWYNKAAEFMIGKETRAAFVATNSICQGESVGILWRHLFGKGIHIDFAHRPFKWQSESEDPAAVHCVIIGFSHAPNDKPKIIFDGKQKIAAQNINGYLLDAPDIFIQNRGKPLAPWLPKMTKGNQPTDGKYLIVEADQYDDFIKREPRAVKFLRPYFGAESFLQGKRRRCLWLVDATADELKLPLIAERLEAVRRVRLKSATASVRAAAKTPHLFTQYRQPTTDYLLVPIISSERRRYIPIGFLSPNCVPNHATYTIADADLFIFGVMSSIVHAAWMRVICGRLEVDYRYSPAIYNNFPWCARSERIEKTARDILDARAKFGECSLASLYDEETMPDELRAAHQENDHAVLDAYGFDHDLSEAEIVSRLMSLYQRLISKE